MELARTFKEFSSFSDLRPNMSKCEIAGIESLKGVETVICSMKNIDLTKDAVEIIGISFSYNSLQCSRLRRLFDNSFHQWKVIPLVFITKNFGEHFKFHSNLDFKR